MKDIKVLKTFTHSNRGSYELLVRYWEETHPKDKLSRHDLDNIRDLMKEEPRKTAKNLFKFYGEQS